MRDLGICLVLAAAGAGWLQWESLRSADFKTSSFRTRAGAVVCATPFQIRKAMVAMARDDGARIRSLACTRPGAGRSVRLVSLPVSKYGPWQIELIPERGAAVPMWGYADQFDADED
jgi:hypothetical protein